MRSNYPNKTTNKFRLFTKDVHGKWFSHADSSDCMLDGAGNLWLLDDNNGWLPNPMRNADFYVSWYLGIDDKNDNPVYELDVIEYRKQIAIVKWDVNKFGFSPFVEEEEVLDEYGEIAESRMYFNSDFLSELVVLGNVLENPDLREKVNT